LVACLSYLLFFIYIKLWLYYVSSRTATVAAKATDSNFDLSAITPDPSLDLPLDAPFESGAEVAEAFSGGGGNFGGGGASASFGDAGGAVADVAKGAGKASGGGGGDLLPDLGDGDFLAFLALAVLLAVVLGAGIFVIYSAPAILSEAAFEFMLAGGLIRRTRKMGDPDWVGSVLRATWKPFGLILIVTLAVGWFLHCYYPEIHRVADLFAE
jgi:hypothetical protein